MCEGSGLPWGSVEHSGPVQGLGFRVLGFGFRVSGLGFRV